METTMHFTCAMCRVEMEGESAAVDHLASPAHAYQMLWLQRRALDTQQQIRDLLLQLVDRGEQQQQDASIQRAWACDDCGKTFREYTDLLDHMRDTRHTRWSSWIR